MLSPGKDFKFIANSSAPSEPILLNAIYSQFPYTNI